ncbi:MAG TPA: GDSL-type esterase/lipase family protein [bacterium]|nr:GDSL-type esterase/lipase family protein [bacterium]HPR88692.1 GDSL-type esterase/lipase family protein [bacterium]
MPKALLYLLILSLLGNCCGLLVLYKAYDYRKKMILAWAQSDEWASEFKARLTPAEQKQEGVDLVLLGASITAHWDPSRHLTGYRIVNKGIDGQYASQLLLRFQHDVADLHPRAVVIKLCEMNFSHDVPVSISRDNVKMLTALAQANAIRPLVATVIPVTAQHDAGKNHAINRQIHEFNRWVRDYAREHSFALFDLERALADDAGDLRPEFTSDGVHPNAAGYEVMTELLKQKLDSEGI